jgi:hypothetical protein
MSNPYMPFQPRRSHVKRFKAVAAPIRERKQRAGTPVLAAWQCSLCGEVYQYMPKGAVSGACHVKAKLWQSVQPHEYIACPNHPELPICITHSPSFAQSDRRLREG